MISAKKFVILTNRPVGMLGEIHQIWIQNRY